MTLPKISIVIPSYNKVEYVAKTLQSIVDQKYPRIEVIIQDGGSTDGTLGVIKKYTKLYPKVFSFESKKDKGQSDAINRGFNKASGEILAYISADDIYEKGALLIVGKYFRKYPETLWLAGKGITVSEKGIEIAKPVTFLKNLLLSLNSYTLLLTVNYLMQPSVFFTRSLFLDNGTFHGVKNAAIEYEYWLKLGRRNMPSIIYRNLSRFRLSSDSLSASSFENILREDFVVVKKFTKNKIIIFLHWLINLVRKFLVKFINQTI